MTPVAPPTPAEIVAHEVGFARSLMATYRELYPDAGGETLEVGSGVAVFALEQPFSRVFGFGMGGPIEPDDVARIESFYHERRTAATIETVSYAHPSVLERLGPRGYRIGSFKQLLVRPLAPEDRSLREPAHGVAVVPVGPAEEESWIAVVARGFLERDEVDPRSHQLYRTLFRVPSTTSWLATVNGEPAAGACLSIGDGLASLATACVLPAFRRHGIQAALIAARLAFAAGAGCAWARVSAYPGSGSERNLARAGFRVAYTRVKLSLAAGAAPPPSGIRSG